MLKKSKKSFIQKFIITFKALFVRILMIVHASLAVYFLITEKNLCGVYYLLILPIIFVGIEGVAITIYQAKQDVKRFWPICAICYLGAVIPIIWIIEFDAMETKTSTYGTLIGMWTKLGMFLVLIAGRCIVSAGEISSAEITVILLDLVGHAPDSIALLNSLNEKINDGAKPQKNNKVENQTYKLIVLLVVFSLSAIQFAIKTPNVDKKSKTFFKRKKYDKSKYFDFGCCSKEKLPLPTNESERLLTFKKNVVDKVKQLPAREQEARHMVAEGKVKMEEVNGMLDDAKATLDGVRENTKAMLTAAKDKAQEGDNGSSSLKGSVMEKTKAVLKNKQVKKICIYFGVLLHFISCALHAGSVFVVRLVMVLKFAVYNEVHIFFLVKNGFECIFTIYQFIQNVLNSKSLEKDFNVDDALGELEEIPCDLSSFDQPGDSGKPSAGTSGVGGLL